MIGKIKTHTCERCNSKNFEYNHRFDPMTLKSDVSFKCKDCGHIEGKYP